MAADIDSIMRHAPILAASDLFLREGEYAHARLDDRFQAFSKDPISREAMEKFWRDLGADPAREMDHDASYVGPDGARFRVSLHRHCGRLGAILRRLRHNVPHIEGLGLPVDELRRWVGRSPGLIMVCGPTGSGKSTTMAALIDEINHNNALHIVSIEDPIEYVFDQGASLLTQRQVGIDTASYAAGIRSALRQGVDMIMVGEVRDRETAEAVLNAAETGHLVMTTLHNKSVLDAIERFGLFFDSAETENRMTVLSHVLIGLIAQRLVTGVQGEPVLLTEHLEVEGAVRGWIEERDHHALKDFMARRDKGDNRSFTDTALEALEQGRIDQETARASVGRSQDLDRALRGVSAG